MKSSWKALAWTALGGFLGVAASVGVREATRTPVAALDLAPPPSPGILPIPPAAAGTTEPPPPPPPAPPPRPPAFDFFGFAVESAERAADAPPPAPRILRFAPLKGRCVAGFDATSTLHDFRGWTKAVDGWIRFEEGRLEETAAAAFSVEARTLETNNAERDREMHQEHLQSHAYPEMRFELSGFRATQGGACTMQGALEIRGRAKEVEIPGVFELRPDGHLHVRGELKVKMSDFGITPPTTALVIKVDDEIKVWFEVWARREEGRP